MSGFLGSSPDSSGNEDAQEIDTGLDSGTVVMNFQASGNQATVTIYYPPRADGGTAILSDTILGNATIEVDFGGGSSTEIEIVVNEGGGTVGTTWDYSGSVSPQLDLSATIDGNGNKFQLTPIDRTPLLASVGDILSAKSALTDVKQAIDELAIHRAQAGANITRMRAEQESLSILNENIAAARSRIHDTDFASESTEFVQQKLLVDSGTAMAAQANLFPSIALRLLT